MPNTYSVVLITHITLIWVLIISDIYMYYLLIISKNKIINKINKFRYFLPSAYTILSILFFTGITLVSLNASIGMFNANVSLAYMIFATLFYLISKIKIYKKTKELTSTNYKKQIEFLHFSKKALIYSLLILIMGNFSNTLF